LLKSLDMEVDAEGNVRWWLHGKKWCSS
jgi:hypothetical protein